MKSINPFKSVIQTVEGYCEGTRWGIEGGIEERIGIRISDLPTSCLNHAYLPAWQGLSRFIDYAEGLFIVNKLG